MSTITFDVLRKAWSKLKNEKAAELKRMSPNLSNPGEIFLKRVDEDEESITVQFSGFENATDDATFIPQLKRVVLNWLRKISMDTRVMRSEPDSLIVRIDTESKIDEAAISIFKRDPKTNKRKNYYKCIGGKKNGRRVASPDDCIGVPDFNKRVKFSISKRAKSGQSGLGKKKTKITNIVAKKIRKANARVKKARGF